MMLKRVMGKACFATLQDMSGRIQLYVTTRRASAPTSYDAFKHWDLGDIVGARARCSRREPASCRVEVRRSCACWRRRCGRCRRNSTA